ncbi:MAG: saccharopine dehydrogenase NADP-binding domain-containing protein [Ignavibacteriales bacterium]|nr:MAG: saccharopine dehydrogenase NADP-binding domain-containing protein [Ignavibacteriales bacterium]
MKKKITVLGSGMVGSVMAVDLSNNYDVTCVDLDEQKLDLLKNKPGIKTLKADLSDQKIIQDTIKDCDLVVCAVPGFMGFETIKTIIALGKDVVDISFFDQDPFELDNLAKEKDVTAIVDCGVAPGMSNIILGYHKQNMEIDEYECLVGGLPFQRSWPFQYKAPFSPSDVIEEYTREARYVENSRIVYKPALSEPEYVEFDKVGTLEAFNTDGLRSLIKTMNIPNMKEKTLRYPGHIEHMRVLSEAGFFSKELIDIKGKKIRPLDVTSALLFPLWKLENSEPEFTVMRITIKGIENNVRKEYTYHLFDTFDEITGNTSMARTTGYTCTAAVKLVMDGKFVRKGICPPEFIGAENDCFNLVNSYLKERNVIYTSVEKVLN